MDILRRAKILRAAAIASLAILPACDDGEEIAAPKPQELTREAIGYYCNMIVADHPGPKAQLFLEGESEPLWFSSVRDAVAFTMLPGEPKAITAVYVNDMSRADWARPQEGTWIPADRAHFVIGSSKRGGMGALETVPFSNSEAASEFVHTYGGDVVSFSAIPRDYVLSSDDPEEEAEGHETEGHGHAPETH